MQTYAVLVPINHNWTVSFPEHLAQLRKERGFTQPQLAEKIGASRQWVVGIERGHSRAELGLVLRTLDTLGIRL